MKTSFRIFVSVLMLVFWCLLGVLAGLGLRALFPRTALAAHPVPAAPIRANAARIIREPAPDRASVESHVRPTPQGVPPAFPFGVLSASICNPATAGARVMSGPGGLLWFSPVKQYGACMSPTLPAVAGSISA